MASFDSSLERWLWAGAESVGTLMWFAHWGWLRASEGPQKGLTITWSQIILSEGNRVGEIPKVNKCDLHLSNDTKLSLHKEAYIHILR